MDFRAGGNDIDAAFIDFYVHAGGVDFDGLAGGRGGNWRWCWCGASAAAAQNCCQKHGEGEAFHGGGLSVKVTVKPSEGVFRRYAAAGGYRILSVRGFRCASPTAIHRSPLCGWHVTTPSYRQLNSWRYHVAGDNRRGLTPGKLL